MKTIQNTKNENHNQITIHKSYILYVQTLGCIYNQNFIPGKSKEDVICEHIQSSIASQHYKKIIESKIKKQNVRCIIITSHHNQYTAATTTTYN